MLTPTENLLTRQDSMVGHELNIRPLRGSVQHRGEGADLVEADPPVQGAGGRVEVVDVQGHVLPLLAAQVDDGRHRWYGQAAAAKVGPQPHTRYLTDLSGGRADVGLEDDLAVLDDPHG